MSDRRTDLKSRSRLEQIQAAARVATWILTGLVVVTLASAGLNVYLLTKVSDQSARLTAYIAQARVAAIMRTETECGQVEKLKANQRKLARTQLRDSLSLIRRHKLSFPPLTTRQLVALTRQSYRRTVATLTPVDCVALATSGPRPPPKP